MTVCSMWQYAQYIQTCEYLIEINSVDNMYLSCAGLYMGYHLMLYQSIESYW